MDDKNTTTDIEEVKQEVAPLAPAEVEPDTAATTPVGIAGSTSSPEPTPEVVSQPNAIPVASVVQPKKKRKGLLVGGIIAAALLVLGGGAFSAYALWYQNSDKIVSDAIGHALSAKSVAVRGSFKVAATSASNPVSIAVDVDMGAEAIKSNTTATMTVDYQGKKLTLKGSAISVDDGTVYVKVAGVREVINELLGEYASVYLTEDTTALIDKVDDQWIKISADDLKDIDDTYANVQTCATEVLEKTKTDKTYQKELTDLYKKHQFLEIGDNRTVEKIDGVASYKFTITGNTEKAKSFSKGLADTKLYKELKACDETIVEGWTEGPSDASKGTTGTTTVTLWVSQLKHEITKFELVANTDDAKGSLEVLPTFNGTIDASAPSSSISLSELQASIQEMVQSYGSGVSSQSYNYDDTYSSSYEL